MCVMETWFHHFDCLKASIGTMRTNKTVMSIATRLPIVLVAVESEPVICAVHIGSFGETRMTQRL